MLRHAILIAWLALVDSRYSNPDDWLSYDRDNTGQRYSPLEQITPSNIRRLVPVWAYQRPRLPSRTEATPIVRDGIMYLTVGGEEAHAIDARTGRPIWTFEYAAPAAAARRTNWNRGFAISGNRVFMATDDCALVALDARSGALLWRVQLADPNRNYNTTGAPLVVKNRVLMGVRGGDTGRVRGFLDAFDTETGERAWRFYTVPAPGEPGSETWPGNDAWKAGGGATWTTGTYDPDLNLVYWPTGNPGPNDFDGSDRQGDNLYTCAVVALHAETGKRVWHYQFTPHDLNDWDGSETPVLLDAVWRGRPRKLLVQANRNGFFYVLDRTNGQFLLGEPFTRVNWAKGIGADGRPERIPNMRPASRGTYTCPDIHGGTNWQAPSYHPATGLFYFNGRDACGYFYPTGSSNDTGKWKPGQSVKAIDIQTGKVRWTYPFLGNQELVIHAGVMATAGGLLFVGGRDGQFIALDARDGQALWHFNTGGTIRSSPMSYRVDGRQHVVIFSKAAVFSFALME
jgi:alcohol dehydrogenase (cytochrome c)